jgi:DNA topoisomerase VI subunit B
VKELKPRLVATYSDRPGSHDGHPFLVEAAVSLGGTHLREGINVYRFANRIPLLFEAGADVVTQVATKRINWSSYHIDPRKDNIGVYVSIVSTKIPFKGTSKEYVGDDVVELMQSVRRAIQGKVESCLMFGHR